MQIKVEDNVAAIRIESSRIELGNCGNLTQNDEFRSDADGSPTDKKPGGFYWLVMMSWMY